MLVCFYVSTFFSQKTSRFQLQVVPCLYLYNGCTDLTECIQLNNSDFRAWLNLNLKFQTICRLQKSNCQVKWHKTSLLTHWRCPQIPHPPSNGMVAQINEYISIWMKVKEVKDHQYQKGSCIIHESTKTNTYCFRQ